MRLLGRVAHIRDTRNAYKILIEKPEGKRPLGRPRRRLEGCHYGSYVDRVGRCELDEEP
jgi:hypothetical protein